MSDARKWDPKGLREALCQQQVLAPYTRDRELMQELVDRLDLHRPLGSDGKHSNLHTPTCGCDDRGPTNRPRHRQGAGSGQ